LLCYMFPFGRRSTSEGAPLAIQLREINNESHSHPELAETRDFLEDLNTPQQQNDFQGPVDGIEPPSDGQVTDFGQDTVAKSVAYASDEIYVEDMWGELVRAEPGQMVGDRDRIRCIARIPDQSIPDVPGQSVPSLPGGAIEVSMQFGSMLKDAAGKIFGKVMQQMQQRQRNSYRKPPRRRP